MLSINPSELIWAVINFLLLLLLLNRFLYKPLLRFMDARQEKIDAGPEEERRAGQTVQENRDRLADLTAQSREQAKQQIAQADAAREAELTQAIAQAKKDAEAARRQTVEELNSCRDADEAKLAEAAPELAELLARQLLGDKASGKEA